MKDKPHHFKYKTELFLLLVLSIVVVSKINDWHSVENFSKPLLMPIIAFKFFRILKISRSGRFILYGLFFSFLGDILLMPLFDNFIAGLAMFLITHFFYILAYYKIYISINDLNIKRSINAIIISLLPILIGVFFIIRSMIDNDIPSYISLSVMFYSLVISTMFLLSVLININTNKYYLNYLNIASGLFILSDLVIALNKFVVEIPLSGLIIMSSYVVAQYLISKNYSRYIRNESSV